jgi:Protein of unknown function (DUF2852)
MFSLITEETGKMHHQSTDTIDQATGQSTHRACCGSGMARRRWSAPEIGVVIGSFILFWPLGIAALAIKLFKGELWRGASDAVPPWQNWKQGERFDFTQKWKSPFRDGRDGPVTGNAAFDDYRKSALEKLEAERRKLDDERKEFGDYVEKLRRAKDQDEFDRFMKERMPKAE